MRSINLHFVPLVFAVALATSPVAGGEADTAKWEPEIAKFEASDRASMPAPGGILFVGSSSIRLWDTKASFPDLEITNRGFGGSTIRDATALANRIVIPYRPALIVLYAGDNDIAAGRSPEEVAGDFEEFANKVRAALPDSRILYLSIKLSRSRWELRGKAREANRQIEQCIAKQKNMEFVDVARLLLNDAGEPDPACFQPDQLHLSPEGYRRWNEVLRPKLKAFAATAKSDSDE